jgi:hypothetical protein
VRWARYVARMGYQKYIKNFNWKPEEWDHLEDLGAGRRIILKLHKMKDVD